MFRWAENNDDARISRNGEHWLMRQLLAAHAERGAKQPLVVFDVGANRGDYTRAILAAAAEIRCLVEVHAFEPSPKCVEALRRELSGDSRVRIVATAVSECNGVTSLFGGSEGSTHASLIARENTLADGGSTVEVRQQRLDGYLSANAISRVGLLKLDVEGLELAALRGLGDRLDPAFVEVVQCEYGGATFDAGASLRDLYRLFESRGYAVAKLFPHSLEVRPYRPWMEQFAYANYVALAPRLLPPG